MGWIAPLYALGALAIALPIIFHLIRRTPTGRQDFSSLMFLRTSPPRLTKRSRLNNILLLILRSLAIILLAIAFIRPYFNKGADSSTVQSSGRRVAILIDASASMNRGDLWKQAGDHVDKALKDLSPADEVSLLAFDRQVRPLFTFTEWNETQPAQRIPLLRSRLAEAKPTWSATRLGEALATAADLLAESESKSKDADKLTRQIILVSDLQEGGHIEALQGHQWPANVVLDIKTVAPKTPGNAAVQWVKQTPSAAEDKPDNRLRVRVANQSDSTKENFTLSWANAQGVVAGIDPVKLYVAPGRNQIARVAWPTAGQQVDRLVLSGDDADFDNTLYIVAPRVDSMRVVFIGDDAADDIKGLRYYLNSALSDTAQRKVEFIGRRPDEALTDTDLIGARLVIASGQLAQASTDRLRKFTESGGDVLVVMKSAADTLLGEALDGTEATGDFALIARVDLAHVLFAPFNDARFGDFTKIHFWRHRKIKAPANARVLAAFDSGDPLFIEKQLGKGRLWLLASGWHPADSQLALSTKFVPLLAGMTRRKDAAIVEAQYAVNESIALPTTAARTLTGPDGKAITLAANATAFDNADRPGIYRLSSGGEEIALAVNLPPDESRTTPVSVEEIEQFGAKLGAKPPTAESILLERRLRMAELENRQKLWRWLIVGVLGLLAIETALAGRVARRAQTQQVTA